MAWSPRQRSTLGAALAARYPDNHALRALIIRLDLIALLGRLDLSDGDSVLPDILIYLEACDLVDAAWLGEHVGAASAYPALFAAFVGDHGHVQEPRPREEARPAESSGKGDG